MTLTPKHWAVPTIMLIGMALSMLSIRRDPQPAGTLLLSFEIKAERSGDFSEIELVSDWAGANQHPSRDASWSRIEMRELERVLIPNPDPKSPNGAGGPTDMHLVSAAGALEPGDYKRIFISTPDIRARRPDSSWRRLTSHVEPMALPFRLEPDQTLHIALELIVLPGPEEGMPEEVFVASARVLDPDVEPAPVRTSAQTLERSIVAMVEPRPLAIAEWPPQRMLRRSQ